jgi:hypothetical protein
MKKLWIGVSLAVVVLLVILVTQVIPRAGRASQLKREVGTLGRSLEAARPGTPSREDIGSWKRYGSDLSKARKEIASFYADHDRHFERWFSGLPVGSGGAPSRDAFMSRWRDEVRDLEEALGRRGVKVGPENEDRAPGFNWEEMSIRHLEDVGRADEPAVLRKVQKRFWARQRIADLALREGVRLHRVVNFRFFDRLHDRIRVDGTVDKGDWPGVPRDFQEADLPGGLGRTFTFAAVLELPQSEVPRAIGELLHPGPDLLVLIGSQVKMAEPVILIEVRVDKDKPDKEQEEQYRNAILQAKKDHPPRDVMLTVTCRIFDFDLSPAK